MRGGGGDGLRILRLGLLKADYLSLWSQRDPEPAIAVVGLQLHTNGRRGDNPLQCRGLLLAE